MPESKRLETSTPDLIADRDSRAEALLVEGLDQYFAGHYQDAIHLWTRVLFLDRSHARARAYIDRARTALAERQRRGEEMLHATGELIGRGDVDRARHLLTEAVATGGDDERAAELRVRLERIERAQGGGSVPSSGQAAVVDAVPVRSWRRRLGSGAALLIAAALGALLVMAAAPLVQGWFGRNGDVPRVPADVAPAPLPVLSSTDVALIRARTLFARGRLAEALEALDRARPSSTNVADADALRIEIQQALLATAPGRMPAPAGQSGAERP